MSGSINSTSDTTLLSPDPADELLRKSSSHSLRRHSLTFRHFIALGAVIILGPSGTVPFSDIAFFLLFPLYVHFLSCFAFPLPPLPRPRPAFSSACLRPVYISLSALLGLLLPAAYILHGVLEGDKAGICAAAPHLFLVAGQVFTEGVLLCPRFSLPVWAFVPVSYNARRLFSIADWARSEFGKEKEVGFRVVAGRALAIANMAFWAFNLYGFLLPVWLPWTLKNYYANGANLGAKE